MVKAWEKVQKFGEKITNLKAWLYQVTRNFCIDLIFISIQPDMILKAIVGLNITNLDNSPDCHVSANVKLGKLKTDDVGRLIVLGGHGKSAFSLGYEIDSFANNDG
ncbi:MAG: hypothetical protein F6J86_00020 [Symploca sp. SIO1B1]|nr:hypothetical protein [Symploca sp. SIO1B1]